MRLLSYKLKSFFEHFTLFFFFPKVYYEYYEDKCYNFQAQSGNDNKICKKVSRSKHDICKNLKSYKYIVKPHVK
jgi:hypothetical protein